MSEKGQGDAGSAGSDNEAVDDAPESPVRVAPGLALDETGNEVEVELPSDFILDSAGEGIDADAAGATTPGGQGTPGGRPEDGSVSGSGSGELT